MVGTPVAEGEEGVGTPAATRTEPNKTEFYRIGMTRDADDSCFPLYSDCIGFLTQPNLEEVVQDELFRGGGSFRSLRHTYRYRGDQHPLKSLQRIALYCICLKLYASYKGLHL